MTPPRATGDGTGEGIGLAIARSLGRVEANQEVQRKQLDDLDQRFDYAQGQRDGIGRALETINGRLDQADRNHLELTKSQGELKNQITGLDKRVAKIEIPMQDALAFRKYRRDLLRQVSIWGFSAVMFAWTIVEPAIRWLLTGVMKQWFGWN